MSGGGGSRRRTRLHPARRDAETMARRPWLDAQEAGRVGREDAKRISAYCYSRALAGEDVTVVEVARLLARSRDYVTTQGGRDGGTSPTKDELARARFGLQELVRRSPRLKKFIRLEGDTGE